MAWQFNPMTVRPINLRRRGSDLRAVCGKVNHQTFFITILCNGSTTDFDSVSLGSTPDMVTGGFSLIGRAQHCGCCAGSMPVVHPNIYIPILIRAGRRVAL